MTTKIDLFRPESVIDLQMALLSDGIFESIQDLSYSKNVFQTLLQNPLPTKNGKPLSAEILNSWFAAHCKLEWLKIDTLTMPLRRCIQYVSREYALQQKILILDDKNNELLVGLANPLVNDITLALAKMLDKKVRSVFINPNDFEQSFKDYYELEHKFSSAEKRTAGQVYISDQNNIDISQHEEYDGEIIAISDQMLEYAFQHNVSDIHIEQLENSSVYRMRIDGILHQIHELPKPVAISLINRFKVISQMDICEMRRPQDGRAMIKAKSGVHHDIRLSTIHTHFGEKMVIRIFNPDKVQIGIEQNGMPLAMRQQWQQDLQLNNGLIVVVGPTGSGKTTTLYHAMQYINNSTQNIYTVEDPVEMVIPGLNQVQVKSEIDFSFVNIIRALLRQDPDIIMVGEVRDAETAQMSLRAALTGHLVLTTVHARDCISCLTRLIDMGIPLKLLVNSVRCILSQRLLRKLCERCKQPSSDLIVWHQLFGDAKPPKTLYEPKGCSDCHFSGYLSRQPIFEYVNIAQNYRFFNATTFRESELRQKLQNVGTLSLIDNVLPFITDGTTSCSEALRTLGKI